MNSNIRAKIITFQEKGDELGKLVVCEGLKDIPFEIKRIFYIYGTREHVIRGRHANRESEFLLINIKGQSKVKVDYGNKQEIFKLDAPNVGLYIPKMLWKDMYDFSEDSILMVLASEPYIAEEYIKDYQAYKAEVLRNG